MDKNRLTLIAGGTGAAKFVYGINQVIPQENLRIISNTADDIEMYGLRISPDVDIILYTLAGIVNKETGWGIAGDTFECLNKLSDNNEEKWFNIGDRDMATNILRTKFLKEGKTVTEFTSYMKNRLKISPEILPMSNQFIYTEVETPQGAMHFQEFLIKHKNSLDVLNVTQRLHYSEKPCALEPTLEVTRALTETDGVIICPSNPVASIGPVLLLEKIRDTLKDRNYPCIAISPLVGGKSLKGPSDKMMKMRGYRSDALGVAEFYQEIIDGIVIDYADADLKEQISDLGIEVLVTDTLMTDDSHKKKVAEVSNEFLSGIRNKLLTGNVNA